MRCYPPNSALLRLRKCGAALALLGFGSLLPSFLSAATSTTPPVGYVKTTLLANSDTFIGTSLTRPPAYVGTVVSAAGTGISVSGDPQWESGAFTYVQGLQPNTYYVRLGAAPEGETNPFEGRTFKVEAGGASELIVTDPLNGDLSTVPAGTKIEVIPYWTLGTLFPPEDAGVTFEESLSPLVTKTKLIPTSIEATGTNLTGDGMYFFYQNKWRKFGQNTNFDFGDIVVESQRPITFRSEEAVGRDFYLNGYVATGKQSVIVRNRRDGRQDNVLSISMPIPASIAGLNLIESGAFSESDSPLLIKDFLLIYSNSRTGKNKTSDGMYYYYNDGWRMFGANSSLDFGQTEVSPDVKVVVRKYTGSGESQLWVSESL